jgi:hypothetical protein
MAERGVAQVMGKADGLDEVGIGSKVEGDPFGDLRHFE